MLPRMASTPAGGQRESLAFTGRMGPKLHEVSLYQSVLRVPHSVGRFVHMPLAQILLVPGAEKRSCKPAAQILCPRVRPQITVRVPRPRAGPSPERPTRGASAPGASSAAAPSGRRRPGCRSCRAGAARLLVRLVGAEDQAQRRLLAGLRLVLLEPPEVELHLPLVGRLERARASARSATSRRSFRW